MEFPIICPHSAMTTDSGLFLGLQVVPLNPPQPPQANLFLIMSADSVRISTSPVFNQLWSFLSSYIQQLGLAYLIYARALPCISFYVYIIEKMGLGYVLCKRSLSLSFSLRDVICNA